MIETSKIDLGFSAKQVLSLVPEAVDIHENKIPSMMEMIDVKNQVIRTKKRIEAHENDTAVFYQDDREIRVKIIKKMSKIIFGLTSLMVNIYFTGMSFQIF